MASQSAPEPWRHDRCGAWAPLSAMAVSERNCYKLLQNRYKTASLGDRRDPVSSSDLAPVLTFGRSTTNLLRFVRDTPNSELITEALCAQRASCGSQLPGRSGPPS
jgi:hypothetical protein